MRPRRTRVGLVLRERHRGRHRRPGHVLQSRVRRQMAAGRRALHRTSPARGQRVQYVAISAKAIMYRVNNM